MDSNLIRQKIGLRLEEKNKQKRAQQQGVWLLLIIYTLILISLYRLGKPHVWQLTTNPAAWLAALLILPRAWLTNQIFKKIKHDELELAASLTQLTFWINSLLILTLAADAYLSAQQLPHQAEVRIGIALAPLLFYIVAEISLLGYMAVVYRRMVNYLIHSRNQQTVQFLRICATWFTLSWWIAFTLRLQH
jgi:hypothetical protein